MSKIQAMHFKSGVIVFYGQPSISVHYGHAVALHRYSKQRWPTSLKVHLGLHPEQQPPTNALVWLAELVPKLNCFDFDGNYYQQVRDVAMRTKNGTQLCVPVCCLRREKNAWRISRKEARLVQTVHRWRPWRLLWYSTRSRELHTFLFNVSSCS